MNLSIFLTVIGMLTVKEHCIDFNCKLSKTFKQSCRLNFDGKRAYLLGVSADVKQFM